MLACNKTYNALSQSISLSLIKKLNTTLFIKQEWSDDELDSLLRTYDLEVPTADAMDYKSNDSNTNINNNNNKLSVKGHNNNNNNLNVGKLNKYSSLQMIKDYSKSLPGNIGKGIGKIKSVSQRDIKVPIKPYGGHVEASHSAIEEEFGSDTQHIKEYNVKKRNKLGRDKNRKAVVDIPLQVLRIKDTNNKTHKEHIVSSISDHALVGMESQATQIIIKFHDNRDYFLTFETNQQCIEFRDLIEKLRKFNLKMITNRPPNKNGHKGTMTAAMTVGNLPTNLNREFRSSSMSQSTTSTVQLKPGRLETPQYNANVENNTGFFDDDDEMSMSQQTHPNGGGLLLQPNGTRNTREHGARDRFDTEMFEGAADDGNVYTGMQTSNVVYRIIKINKWGTKKERTMIVHKADRTVRLFDDKRRCHSEYPLKIMATLDIIDSLNVEVVFTLDQKPTQFVFRSHVDMWDFVEQIRTIAPNEIMVNDRRIGNSKKATIAPKGSGKNSNNMNNSNTERPRSSTKDMLGLNDDKTDDGDDEETELAFNEDLDVNPNVLRYSVLRLIRSQARVRGAGVNQQVTWRQHRRCIYLDLEKRIVRMLTLGMHIKDYKFEDILLLEKSYINANQLHMTCKHKQKVKEYWYEFVSPQARAEFVGRLLRALPGTKQSHSPLSSPLSQNDESSGSSTKKKKSSSSSDNKYKPQINIYADLTQQIQNGTNITESPNPDVLTQSTISPSPRSKKKEERDYHQKH